MGGAGEGGVGLGDVYGKLVVILRVGCCIAKHRYDQYGPAKGGFFLYFLLIARGIGTGILHILTVDGLGIYVLSGDGAL